MKRDFKHNKQLRLAVVAVVLLAAAAFVWVGVLLAIRSQRAAQPETTVRTLEVPVDNVEPEIPSVLPRKTDGLLVASDDANNHPIGIMIENAAFGGVRPQSGLSKAQIVYEMMVEGGITRFMAVFSGDLPEVLGPVRSARPTYLEFISEYDGLYGHAGGSPEALQAIDGLGIKDLSALGGDARYFYRETGKVAPHNLYTTAELLSFALRDKELENVEVEFNSWEYKEDARPRTQPDTERFIQIDFPGSSQLYQSRYVYHYTENNYTRFNGGIEHRDANTGNALTARNILVQMVPPAISAGEKGRVNFAVTGEGRAYIARDGEVIEGTWRKIDRQSRTEWLDATGQPVPLNRGETWVTIVPEGGVIEYQ